MISFSKKALQYTLTLSALFLVSTAALANDYTDCPESMQHASLSGSLCANISVPLRHDNITSTHNINLFVRKFPAQQTSTGSIWLIAGGPGESGASFYSIIDTFRQSFPSLDIYIPDHRGTGASTTICQEESINSSAGTALVGAEWGSCFASMYKQPDFVQAFSITHAAKDLRQLINKHGSKGKQYIYSVSYGTQLSLRLLQLDNIKLDGLILDSLVPLQNDKQFGLSQRSFVVDKVGHQLLQRCQQHPSCGQDKDLIQIAKSLSRQYPNLASIDPKMGQQSLSASLGVLLDIPSLRHRIPEILLELNNQNGQALLNALQQAKNYYESFNQGYPNFGSSIPLVQVITAAENNLQPELSRQEVKQQEQGLSFSSPLPSLMAEVTLPRYKRDKYFSQLPKRLPNTLVLHGDLDPKTHYQGAVQHIAKLKHIGNKNITLITASDAPHFIALNAPACFQQYSQAFVNGHGIKDVSCQDDKSKIHF